MALWQDKLFLIKTETNLLLVLEPYVFAFSFHKISDGPHFKQLS